MHCVGSPRLNASEYVNLASESEDFFDSEAEISKVGRAIYVRNFADMMFANDLLWVLQILWSNHLLVEYFGLVLSSHTT